MQSICIKAQSCRSAPSCQHGRPHTSVDDCSVRACFVGGQVRCKPVMLKAKNAQGSEVLADNVDSITGDFNAEK